MDVSWQLLSVSPAVCGIPVNNARFEKPAPRVESRMLFKSKRTPFVQDMGGFVAHLNMPGLLDPKSRDHGHGPLALVVESILAPGRLIPMHEHRNDEIVSWVPAGVMRHDDRVGGQLVVDKDHLMVMNAGKSFWHSERTLPGDPPLRMLQILVRPREIDLEPRIHYGRIAAAEMNHWRHLAGPEDGDAPFHLRNAIDLFDIRLKPGAKADFPSKNGSDLYFYVFTGSILTNGMSFREGEQGLFIGGGVLQLESSKLSVVVAFLIGRDAPITREGTVGDHRKIPPVWVLRLVQQWKQFTHWLVAGRLGAASKV
jgi:redox-sensitive bicupin YhaK (pirin superfamily)